MRNSQIRLSLALVYLLTCTAGNVIAAEIKHEWPSYRGQNDQFADTSGVPLIDDMTKAKLLWESEEQRLGFGKTDTGFWKNPVHFGDLDPGGIASPIVAGGLVIVSYTVPTGEAINPATKPATNPDVWEKHKHKFRIAADDVVVAIDAATGKTKWKAVFPGQGRNPGSDKRSLFGMTPVAAKGHVYAMGSCGALYALELATGKVVWQTPNWPELEAEKQTAIKTAAEGKGAAFGVAAGPTGWLLMVDGVLIVPVSTSHRVTVTGRCRGVDPATGKTLWEAPVHPNALAPATVAGKASLVSQRVYLEAKTGKVVWNQDDRPVYYCPVLFGKELLISYDVHPQAAALLNAKQGGNKSDPTAFGVLAGFTVDEKGTKLKWRLPPQYRRWMLPDCGGRGTVAVRDGLVYHICEYQEKEGSPMEHRAVIVREADGTILASAPVKGSVPYPVPYLWGDRLIVVTDIWHRPRAANPEIWQMYAAATLKPLGSGWHVNGNPQVHVATGGYELSLLEAFADGLMFCRVAGGIRCYDLRRQ